jgi:hypothetical protein
MEFAADKYSQRLLKAGMYGARAYADYRQILGFGAEEVY